jgi:predicted aldo/keto reductase-like oxidoreductase
MIKMSESKNRRNFIKNGLAGLAGLTFIPGTIKSTKRNYYHPGDGPFIYRTLGRTGIRLPVISMGVMNSNNPNLVKAALDAGIIHLDTAWNYQMGRNEEMVGRVIKDKPRDSVFIATKILEPRDSITGLFPANATSKTFLEKFDTSLKRLGLDYVDILYQHDIAVKEALLFEPYLEAMEKIRNEGKARFIGVSTHQNEPEIIRAATDSEMYDIVLTAYNFRQVHVNEIKKAIDYAAKAGMGIVGMKAIAGSVQNIGRKVNVNAKAALKWALQNENIHTNIPGFTTFDQMEEDISIMENLEFTPEEKEYLELSKNTAGLYCQQCRECIKQCKYDIDIPSFMRSYMYAYGYKNLVAAREAIDHEDLDNIPCRDCKKCLVNCPMNFDIREKILDISRIKNIPEEFLV